MFGVIFKSDDILQVFKSLFKLELMKKTIRITFLETNDYFWFLWNIRLLYLISFTFFGQNS